MAMTIFRRSKLTIPGRNYVIVVKIFMIIDIEPPGSGQGVRLLYLTIENSLYFPENSNDKSSDIN